VLFGGASPAGWFDDTWEWDSMSWTLVNPPVRPPPRGGHGMAFDSSRSVTVMFAGANATAPSMNDVWEWNGALWLTPAPAVSPSPRFDAKLTYDSARRRIVLHGGQDAAGLYQQETYDWDGTAWTRIVTQLSPTRRALHGLAFDSARDRVVLFGGASPNGPLNDTFELVDPCVSLGPGQATGGPALVCSSAPRLGTTFQVGFSSAGTAGLWLGGCQLPPLVLAAPPCLPGSIYALSTMLLLTNNSPAAFGIPVPANAALVETVFCMQGAALQNGSCIQLTDGVRVTLVP
jgi:hypothetical protein